MGRVVWVGLKLLVALVVLSVPLMGVWFASSLAAYFNGPIWLMVLSGALLFPVLPLLWEGWGARRFGKKVANWPAGREVPPRILGFGDRLILRTLVVNLTLLTVLAISFPERGFLALSTRGDWMLTGASGAWVEPTRKGLFAAAGGLEWLYNLSQDNPYRAYVDPDAKGPPKGKGKAGELVEVVTKPEVGVKDGGGEEVVAESVVGGVMSWPPPAELHPLVAHMPAEVEVSIESVAKYILDNEPDPMWRIKALYDYVADRVSYDVEALTGYRPPQHADEVFRTKMAVCAGYAQLLVALGKLTGDEIVYVVGVSRDLDGNVGGGGHAWNAARVGDKWFLLDPTWGSGHVDASGFVKRYNPAFLFAPPHVLIGTHFPEDAGWQLMDEPLTRGEFLRQPIKSARMYANHVRLVEPTRSEITVGSEARLKFDNPRGFSILATIGRKNTQEETRCEVEQGVTVTVRCRLKEPGTYQVTYFGGPQEFGTYEFWGRIGVNGG